MNLSSCRSLKLEVLNRAYRVAEEATVFKTYKVRKARGAREPSVESREESPVAAIGIAPLQGKQYKLAVRLYRGQEALQEQLLRGLGRHEGEIDLVTGVRYQPRLTVEAGGSVGHYKITAGTLGGFVEDNANYYVLSNNHVLANSNQCFGGDPILQPGPADIDGNFKVIARLHSWYPLSKDERDGVDAALATFTGEVDSFYPWDYTGVGRIGKTAVSNRFSVARVIKRGRTTGVTRGTVSAFELDGVAIDYGTASDPAIIVYDDQIELTGDPSDQAFSQPGDSGSFIIDRDTMQPYALLYGGGADSQGIDRTLAHFMPSVLGAMKVKLVQ